MPRRSARCFPRFSVQCNRAAVFSRHVASPQVPSSSPIGVVSPGWLQLIRRISSASMPASSASSSRLLSIGNVTSGFP